MFKRLLDNWRNFKETRGWFSRTIIEIVEFILILTILAIILHQGVMQRRFIPTKSMLPYLQPGDQLIVERISLNLANLGLRKKGFRRGDVIVFYPPFIELKNSPMHILGRMTGFSGDVKIGPVRPFFFMPPTEMSFIKRVIGLPGDRIEIRANEGVFVNGSPLVEPYPASLEGVDYGLGEYYPFQLPNYSMRTLNDIPELSKEYRAAGPVIVPEGHYFCLGDNRNNSNDGHIWGFVPEERVIGRAYAMIWRDLSLFRPYPYSRR